MKPSTRRVRDALREKPCTTHDLCQPDVGGIRFGARVEELRSMGYQISRTPLRQSSHLYTMHAEPGQPSRRPPLPAGWPGRWKLCTHCSYRWEAEGSAPGCPRCEAGAHWLEEWTHRGARDFAARRVDPEKVAAELRHIAAIRADRERRAA